MGLIEGIFFLLIIAAAIWLLTTPYYIYAAIPPAAILTMLLFGRYPQAGYYLIIFMVPFDAFRSGMAGLHFLTVSKLAGILIFVYVIFNMLLKKTSSFDMKSNLWPLLAVFFAVNLVSALMSKYPETAFDSIRQLLTVYVFFLLTLVFVSRKGFLEIFPMVVAAGATLNSLLSILGFLFNIPVLSMNLATLRRATGLTNDPNFFSSIVLFSMPFVAYGIFRARSYPGKFFASAALLINIIAVILTYSRAGAIVLLIVLALLILGHIHRLRPRHFGFLTSAVAAAVICIIFLVPESYWERQKSLADKDDPALGRRVTYVYVAWDAFKKNPLFGTGPGAFREVYAESIFAKQFAFGTSPEHFKRYAHNTYLEIIAGTGIIGFTVFIAILSLTFKNFVSAGKRCEQQGARETASLINAYILSHIAILLSFFFVSSVYHKYFWMPIALSQIAARISQETKKERIA